MASLMKDNVNFEMFHGTPKTLNFFYEVVNWDGVLKSCNRPKGDHAAHL
jgi:hypothetical protein